MSRTKRQRPKGKGTARDGADLRPSRQCRNHGSCPHCLSTRTHATRRRAPLVTLAALALTLAGTCAGTFAAHAATPNATDGALAAAAYADAQAAALAGLTLCQGLTRSGRLECAGAVLHGTEGYTVSALVTGTNDAFTLHVKLAGHSLAAVFHTHPTHGDIDRMFSDNDVAMADALRVPSYIATDDGMHVRLYATGARTHMQPHATRPSAYGVVVF